MFWKKKTQTSRGPSKSAQARLKEEQAKADLKLYKMWSDYLDGHPTYAQEIARQKFGVNFESYPEEMVGGGGGTPDAIELLRQAKEIKELVREESDEKSPSLVSLIPEIIKYLPNALQALNQMQSQQPVPYQQGLQPQPEAKKLESKENTLVNFAERFTSMSPEDAAEELYAYKDNDGDVRAIIWNTITQNSPDDIFGMLPMVENLPQYTYLKPFIDKLTSKKGRIWVSTLIDECHRLISPQNEAKSNDFTPEQ